jgi:hypothetical protein
MGFHIYLEPELQSEIESLCRESGRKRNSVVREALREYVQKRVQQKWPDAVFDFKPDPKLARFESLRGDLLSDRENIFDKEGA